MQVPKSVWKNISHHPWECHVETRRISLQILRRWPAHRLSSTLSPLRQAWDQLYRFLWRSKKKTRKVPDSCQYRQLRLKAPVFTYKPLPKQDGSRREIRLITIHEGDGPELRCSLASVPLDEAPSYEALSYVWGDPKITQEIILDGKSFHVTTNLARALRHFRDNKKPRKLWIDAICIDQRNAEERSSQILLMRDIFQRASKVVVWLGDSTLASRAAFSLVRAVDFGDGTFWNKKENQGPVSFSQNALDELQILLNRRSSLVGLQGIISDIASRPWWTRVWVIQEAAVARSIVVRCGDDEMSWWLFSNVLSAIARLAPDLSGPLTESLILFRKRLSIHMHMSSRSLRSLEDLVANTRIMVATDPKDMVYALLGLAGNVGDPSSHPVCLPDYSAATSVLDVYRDFVAHCISQGSLDIICMRRNYDRLDGTWPSWVPDWSLSGISSSTAQGSSSTYHGFDMIEGGSLINKPLQMKYRGLSKAKQDPKVTPWQASRNTLPVTQIAKSPATLTAKGIYIDRIQDLGEAPTFRDRRLLVCDFSPWERLMMRHFGEGPEQHMFHILDQCHKICLSKAFILQETRNKMIKSMYKLLVLRLPMERIRGRVYARRLSNGRWRHGKYIARGYTIAQAYTRTLFLDRVLGYPRKSNEGVRYLANQTWKSAVKLGLSRKLAGGLNVLRANVLHRQLMISKKGYIGLGPVPAKKGDLICVLYGCSVPVLLRKVDEHYILVGECYVHGLMDGEALDLLAIGKAREKEFGIH
ncbi:heterokaryon incompatibility protein-domain-containing protein [Rhexocercosporidium sp. MPI-PUGE-AT-0058]|nr:heterokaryon incompatibility protein-domain-containing protein [Rhexocercosporidium sp. MPI-PUGE-AT-0058]